MECEPERNGPWGNGRGEGITPSEAEDGFSGGGVAYPSTAPARGLRWILDALALRQRPNLAAQRFVLPLQFVRDALDLSPLLSFALQPGFD